MPTTRITTIPTATVFLVNPERSVRKVRDFVKVAKRASLPFKSMPTRPTAPSARPVSTNHWRVKRSARIVRLEGTNPRTGCRIVCRAFQAVTKTRKHNPVVKHVPQTITRMNPNKRHVKRVVWKLHRLKRVQRFAQDVTRVNTCPPTKCVPRVIQGK